MKCSCLFKKLQEFLEFDLRIENIIVISKDEFACNELLEVLNKELPSLGIIQTLGMSFRVRI